MQLRKIHVHSSLFRLQDSGCKGQDSLAKADMVEGDNRHKQTHTHSMHTLTKRTYTALFSLSPANRMSPANELKFCHGAGVF